MKIVTQTQIRENYGAHDWDGEGECPQYWKMKGGNTFIVLDVSIEQAQDDAFWKSIDTALTSSDESWKEYPVYTQLVDDCELDSSLCESWENPSILTVAPDGGFNAVKTTVKPDIYGKLEGIVTEKVETWLQINGDRQNYMLRFYTETDDIYNWKGELVAA